MAQVPIRTSPVPAVSTSVVAPEHKIGSGLICGEDITAGAPIYIAADNLVYMSGGSGVTLLTSPGAKVHGFAPRGTKFLQGDPITIVHDVDFGYATGLVPGTSYYVDLSTATKGRLNDTAGIAGLRPCAHSIDATRIRVFRSLP